VWEVIDVLGLTKIEVCFKDISSIAVQQTNNEMILFVEIAKLPFFYRGYLQKMKNTRWEHTTDVTGGQASLCRIHILHFARNVLQLHLERLIQSSAHIRQVANITPQMLASFRAHHQLAASTTFTSIVPVVYNPTHNSSLSVPPASEVISFQKPIPTDTENNSGHADPAFATSEFALCTCDAGQCTTKGCLCSRERLWCNTRCKCQGSILCCTNPINQQLTLCAKQSILSPSNSPISANIPFSCELEQVVRLPCRCSSVQLRQIISQYECSECGQQYYYSFCFRSVVSVETVWHCNLCGLCRDFREAHCALCNSCYFVDVGCQTCSADVSDMQTQRNTCTIS
jgi:hypothetical protein